MLTGSIDDTIESNFNVSQIAEEKEKELFLKSNPEQEDQLFRLEDHPNLKGQISIVGLDHIQYTDRFFSLFACNWDLVDCAMMSVGDYGQLERNKWRYQYGSKGMQLAWDALFHRSANTGFENTHDILCSLLAKAESFSDESLQMTIAEFLNECESANIYPWRYYYVKYRVFRPGSFGKYSNSDAKNKPYLFSVMQTKSQWSSNTYMPFLRAADEAHLDRDAMGQRLIYGDKRVVCENSAFVIRTNDSDEVIETIQIAQDENGIDNEDRVLKLKAIAAKLSN